MDELLEYRAKHQAKYQEREMQREKEKELVDTCITEIDGLCDIISIAKGVDDITAKLQHVHTLLQEHKAILPDMMEYGLRIYETFNNNHELYSSFGCSEDIARFKEFEVMMKKTLEACNIDPEIVDIQVDMDCSKDEEIAERMMMAMVLGEPGTSMTTLPSMPKRKRKPKKRSEEDKEFLDNEKAYKVKIHE